MRATIRFDSKPSLFLRNFFQQKEILKMTLGISHWLVYKKKTRKCAIFINSVSAHMELLASLQTSTACGVDPKNRMGNMKCTIRPSMFFSSIKVNGRLLLIQNCTQTQLRNTLLNTLKYSVRIVRIHPVMSSNKEPKISESHHITTPPIPRVTANDRVSPTCATHFSALNLTSRT